MGSDKTNVTVESDEFDWKSISTFTDDEILQKIEEATKCSMSTLTQEHIIQAFRLGVSAITNSDIWKKFVAVEKFRDKNIYRVMRKMNVGEVRTFEFERWAAARVAASKLKADFGCVFKVNKRGYTGEKGDIQVERVK